MQEHFIEAHVDLACPSDTDSMMDIAYVPGVEKYWAPWTAQGAALAKRYQVHPPNQDTEIPHKLACMVPNALLGLEVPPGPLRVAYFNSATQAIKEYMIALADSPNVVDTEHKDMLLSFVEAWKAYMIGTLVDVLGEVSYVTDPDVVSNLKLTGATFVSLLRLLGVQPMSCWNEKTIPFLDGQKYEYPPFICEGLPNGVPMIDEVLGRAEESEPGARRPLRIAFYGDSGAVHYTGGGYVDGRKQPTRNHHPLRDQLHTLFPASTEVHYFVEPGDTMHTTLARMKADRNIADGYYDFVIVFHHASEWFKQRYNPQIKESMYVLVGDNEAYEAVFREMFWILRTQCARAFVFQHGTADNWETTDAFNALASKYMNMTREYGVPASSGHIYNCQKQKRTEVKYDKWHYQANEWNDSLLVLQVYRVCGMLIKLRPFSTAWDARAKIGENLDQHQYEHYRQLNITHLPVNVDASVGSNSSGELTIDGNPAKLNIAPHVGLIWDVSVNETVYLDMNSGMVVVRPPVIAPHDGADAQEVGKLLEKDAIRILAYEDP